MKISSGPSKPALCIAFSFATTLAMAQVAEDHGKQAASPKANAAASVADATRAESLLARAVAHYEQTKDAGLIDFGSKGGFVDRELYVFVISDAGDFLASGGPSSSFIGSNVADQRDSVGKPFFQELLRKARTGATGTVDYRWLNPVDNRVELKKAHFRKVGDRILVVGHYVARGTPPQAQALLARAADALHANSTEAIQSFNIVRGPFSEDDLYAWVIGLSDNRIRADGADPRLTGSDALALRDTSGKPFIRDMITASADHNRLEEDYLWRNPSTGEIERKHSFVRKVDEMLVGVGYYAP